MAHLNFWDVLDVAEGVLTFPDNIASLAMDYLHKSTTDTDTDTGEGALSQDPKSLPPLTIHSTVDELRVWLRAVLQSHVAPAAEQPHLTNQRLCTQFDIEEIQASIDHLQFDGRLFFEMLYYNPEEQPTAQIINSIIVAALCRSGCSREVIEFLACLVVRGRITDARGISGLFEGPVLTWAVHGVEDAITWYFMTGMNVLRQKLPEFISESETKFTARGLWKKGGYPEIRLQESHCETTSPRPPSNQFLNPFKSGVRYRGKKSAQRTINKARQTMTVLTSSSFYTNIEANPNLRTNRIIIAPKDIQPPSRNPFKPQAVTIKVPVTSLPPLPPLGNSFDHDFIPRLLSALKIPVVETLWQQYPLSGNQIRNLALQERINFLESYFEFILPLTTRAWLNEGKTPWIGEMGVPNEELSEAFQCLGNKEIGFEMEGWQRGLWHAGSGGLGRGLALIVENMVLLEVIDEELMNRGGSWISRQPRNNLGKLMKMK